MTILTRIQQPTPPFFKRLRTVGLVLAAVGSAVLASPVALPAALVTAAGYVTLAGSVLTAVSQLTVESEAPRKPSGLRTPGNTAAHE